MAFSYFEDFVVNSTSKSTVFELIVSFRVIGDMLFGIFSQSHTVSRFLISNTELLYWLIEQKTLGRSKSREEFLHEATKLIESTDNTDKQEYLLRLYRKKQYLRIAAREIIEACGFDEIMRELSYLASALVEVALGIAKRKLLRRFKKEYKGFSVIGMGKLGNMELNFSSDIDLLFVHDNETLAEYYNRLASQLINVLSSQKEGGFVYRVDMRLRPGGENAALSLTVDEYENYYATFGQPWERMALIKAYPIAGDMDLGFEFIKAIEPFVFKKSIDIEYIKEVRSLLFKIKKHSGGSSKESPLPPEKMDVKKGKGGIREVEFIVNYFQLIYGGRDKQLRHKSTLEALKLIEKQGYLGRRECKALSESYLFLRRIEHKLQLLDEQQTQRMPDKAKGIKRLAKSLHLPPEDFIKRYDKATDDVHRVFKEIFIVDSALPVFSAPEDIEGFLQEHGATNPKETTKLIVDAVKKFIAKDIKKERIERIFDFAFRFVPANLFEECVKGLGIVDPTYTDSLFDYRDLFEVYMKLLSVGFSLKLSRSGDIFELLSTDADEFEPTSAGFEKATVKAAFEFLLAPYRIELPTVLTSFAYRYIETVAQDEGATGLSIVGYGKLATGELFVGSDLDIVFVCASDPFSHIPKAQKIVRRLKSLFDVDLKLRPYGDKGMLVVDIDYLSDYFDKKAWAWEKQAAQKSRIVYANEDLRRELEGIYERFISLNPPSREEILGMKRKIEGFKTNESDIKSSPGGLTDIEFLAQFLCFDHACIKRGASTLELLKLIEENGIMETGELKEAYKFFTAVLNANRLFSPGSTIKDLGTVEFLLSTENLQDKLSQTKRKVRSIFERVLC